MGDTAVGTDCLSDIDRDKIVGTINNERMRLDHTELTSKDSAQHELELRLDDEPDGVDITNSPGEANRDSLVSARVDEDIGSNSVERADFAFASSTSPEISATDAKESSDSSESADLVTILVLEKTEEEKSKDTVNGEDQITIADSVVPDNNAYSSSIKTESRDNDSGNNDEALIEHALGSACDRNGAPAGSPGEASPTEIALEAPSASIAGHGESAGSAGKTETGQGSERFLILNNNSSPEGTSPDGTGNSVENIGASLETAEDAMKEESAVPHPMDEDKYKQIEILVAAFDGLEENSSNQSAGEAAAATAPVTSPEIEQPSPSPPEAEVPLASVGRRTTSKVSMEPKSEKKVPKAKRSAGPPTRRESAPMSEKIEIPNVVGNGKLRVHGYEKLNEQSGLPELVLVNREILERIISDQEKTITQTKTKLKEMCRICDDLRKVVLAKGLNTVLSQEEANLPVDVVIKMQKLPPHVPTFQTVKVARTANGNYDLHAEGRFYNRVLPVKKWLGVAHAPKPATPLALGANRKITSESKCKVEFNIKVLPKDIVRALTNGDVLTVQQRQRFIDKITYDIIKAKGVPQPQQIQEIAMQVANMYPRSLVILPEGKRKSSLRKRGRADDDDEDSVKSNVPKKAKKESLSKAMPESLAGASKEAQAPAASVPEASAPATPVVKRGRGRPPKNRTPGTTPDPKSSAKTTQAAAAVVPSSGPESAPAAAVNGIPPPAVKRKVGRPKKTVQPEPNPRHVEEEVSKPLKKRPVPPQLPESAAETAVN